MEQLNNKERSMLKYLKKLVNIDSGSSYKEGVDRIGSILKEEYEKMDFIIEVRENPDHGNNLVLRHKDAIDPSILILAHMDTVFPVGTAEKRPFHIKGDRAYGPGVADMKASLVSLLFAVKSLHEKDHYALKNIQIVLNSDEEIGSPTSRAVIEEQSAGKRYALVVEPARENGAIVSSRRGGGTYTLTVKGKASHSGNEPEKGVSAIRELAHKILQLEELNDHENGISINAGKIEGGTATNIIPDHAIAHVDVRITYPKQKEQIEKQIKSVCASTTIKGANITLEGEIDRPPVHLNEKNKELLTKVIEVGSSMGLNIKHVHTGGGSDSAFPTALGVATIDGLGPAGGDFHNSNEYLEIPTFTERSSFLELIILELSK